MTFPTEKARALEGEFTAWALVWTKDYGAGADLVSIVVDNLGNCYTTDWSTTPETIHYRSYAGVDVSTSGWIYLKHTHLNSAFSEAARYVVASKSDEWNKMDIWREGAVVASIDLLVDNPDYGAVTDAYMSSNGKYIAVVVRSDDSADDRYLMLYEGT